MALTHVFLVMSHIFHPSKVQRYREVNESIAFWQLIIYTHLCTLISLYLVHSSVKRDLLFQPATRNQLHKKYEDICIGWLNKQWMKFQLQKPLYENDPWFWAMDFLVQSILSQLVTLDWCRLLVTTLQHFCQVGSVHFRVWLKVMRRS